MELPPLASAATSSQETTPHRRVLIKLSGEALAGGTGLGLDPPTLTRIASQLAEVVASGLEVALVVGGGNYIRGALLTEQGMDRPRADYMGMLGTVMNALALQDFVERAGVETRVQTAITMSQLAEPYVPRRAIRHLEKGRVVIFGAGLGQPFFSTDTAAAQRALEIKADLLLLAKTVDGVYDDDPRTNPDAVRFDHLSYSEVLERSLAVADAAAFSLCRDNLLPMLVFDMLAPDALIRAVRGDAIGTRISDTPSSPLL